MNNFNQFLNQANIQQLMQIYKMVQSSGLTPEELFRQEAKKRGIDADEFMRTLQSLNKK